MIRRGDIYYARLDPVSGSEQGGTRPVVVIQNNAGNRFSPTVIVAAVTSAKKKRLPTHVELPRENGNAGGIVLAEQIRTLDKSRLGEKIGSIESGLMNKINNAIAVSIGIEKGI